MCSIFPQKIFFKNQSSQKVFVIGGGGGVSAGGSCITAPEYKARGQGWDAAGTGLCSRVEGICKGT